MWRDLAAIRLNFKRLYHPLEALGRADGRGPDDEEHIARHFAGVAHLETGFDLTADQYVVEHKALLVLPVNVDAVAGLALNTLEFSVNVSKYAFGVKTTM